MNKLQQMIVASKNGIVYPYQTMKASDATGVPYYILCAYLEQETGGGHNVFGHDASIYRGAGIVTKAKYLAYKAERDASRPRRMQGVGPMQLTWYTIQDRADALGGCWKPAANILTGAEFLAKYRKDTGSWGKAAKQWNTNPSYWTQIADRIEKWKVRLS
jgi:hypothetical protein